MDFIFGNYTQSGDSALRILLVAILLWSLFWKGFALWNSSKNDDRYWFIALLVLNTIGILEIIYLFFFEKRQAARIFVSKSYKKYFGKNLPNPLKKSK